MRGLAYFCFVSAAAYALVGMGFGIVMAASHDHTLSTAHAHLNLLGWVSMAIYGLFYHTVPAAAETRLARIHVVVATLGLWIMIPGVAMAVMGMSEGPAVMIAREAEARKREGREGFPSRPLFILSG